MRRDHRPAPPAGGIRRRHRPGYTDQALAILKTKRKGGYNIVQIDPSYVPAQQETKDVFGVTFQQGRNDARIDMSLLDNVVTCNKNLPDSARRDLIVALITLKYTQSNSVCYAFDGQAIGVGAGQQSRIHCTRLAGTKADTWFLRQHPKALNLPFLPSLGRPERDNVIDSYINGNEEDVCAEGFWEKYFIWRPDPLNEREKRAWLDQTNDVSLASDAFFPFPDNIERARRSGVRYVPSPAAPSGTIWSSPSATTTTWPWCLPDCGCSITKILRGLRPRAPFSWGLPGPTPRAYFSLAGKVGKRAHRRGTLSMGSLPYEPHPRDDAKGATPPLESPQSVLRTARGPLLISLARAK